MGISVRDPCRACPARSDGNQAIGIRSAFKMFSDSSHDRCLDAVRRNLFDWPSSESATGKHGSDTRRRSQEHSAFQARQHLLPGTLPGVGQRRPRRVCDGYGQETAVLEHSHCQYHQHPARDGHVRHAGGDARVGQGRRAGRFCGGGGTPLFSANELDVEVAWFAPQSEYRPTEYLQAWVRFWFDDGLRLHAAKLQRGCSACTPHGPRATRESGFEVDGERLTARKPVRRSTMRRTSPRCWSAKRS